MVCSRARSIVPPTQQTYCTLVKDRVLFYVRYGYKIQDAQPSEGEVMKYEDELGKMQKLELVHPEKHGLWVRPVLDARYPGCKLD